LAQEQSADARRGDFNVIPEDIDCHKPASWIHDALFQPEPRARYRALLALGYTDAFRSLHPGQAGQFTFWTTSAKHSNTTEEFRIDHFLLSPELAGRMETCEIDKTPRGREKPSDHTSDSASVAIKTYHCSLRTQRRCSSHLVHLGQSLEAHGVAQLGTGGLSPFRANGSQRIAVCHNSHKLAELTTINWPRMTVFR